MKSKSLKVAILDLVARQPTRSVYARIVNPNYSSIMPQCVAVWIEQLGHEVHYMTYTGHENLYEDLPKDIDLLFISTFTQAAYTAYSIANIFRKKGVITVLGGPHARSYAEDAKEHFDYVLGLTDKELIGDLLADCAPQPREGVVMSARQQVTSLPTVRERWKFIQRNLDKTRFIQVVPMIGSVGCPYTCQFCLDATIDFQTLSHDRIREDLSFLQSQPKPPIVSWYDPNFGVRFNEIMDVIESVVKPGRMAFGGESSLSLLSEANLKRLKKNNFIVMLPGIESWFDFNGKSKRGNDFGADKVKPVAEQVNRIMDYIPYVQVNFVFGLDKDEGPLPFELTKQFVDLAPGAYPTYMLMTAYGNSAPLNRDLQREGRVLDIPFPFLDGNSGLNIRLKNYSPLDFYDQMTDLTRYTFSARAIWRRFQANKKPLSRWMNLLRATLSGKGRSGNFPEIRNLLAKDREFQAFYAGDTMKPPSYYHHHVREKMGVFYDHLPARTLNYLTHGEAAPNARISASGAPTVPPAETVNVA